MSLVLFALFALIANVLVALSNHCPETDAAVSLQSFREGGEGIPAHHLAPYIPAPTKVVP